MRPRVPLPSGLVVAGGLLGAGFGLALGWLAAGALAGFGLLVAASAFYVVLFTQIRGTLEALVERQRAVEEVFESTIRSLAAAIDARDAGARDHASRVAHHAQAIARALGLPDADVRAVRLASYLHDVGKIGVPDHLLRKPGPLTEEEWAAVRRQAVVAQDMLDPVQIDERVKLAVRHSHERWDGSGYPDGLAGETIPVHARILLVAEAYVAMTSDRPYRKAMAAPDAVAELQRGAGRQFDRRIVDALVTVLEQEGATVWALGPVGGHV
ncbi:MAG: HD-GYP domain-containing protein [Armatimonadota bacterium]|nr:HD-GYP domain-containing protein [Armatimonadota bacterium]